VVESRALRRIFGPRRDEVMQAGGNYIMMSSISLSTTRLAGHVAPTVEK
jgi:hypothetical protein